MKHMLMLVALAALVVLIPPREGARPEASARPVLVTNEYAYHHADAPDARRSGEWVVTSGSLFAVGRTLWTGRPDGERPGPASRTATNSAVLRALNLALAGGPVTLLPCPCRTYCGILAFARASQ